MNQNISIQVLTCILMMLTEHTCQANEMGESGSGDGHIMRELRQEIIRVLTPIFETERMRSVIVNEAFFDVSGITDRVDYGENARVFTSAFLHLLLKHGDVEPGVPAIIALLEVAQYYVDTSEQETLKNIIERYQQASGSTDADIM